MIAHAVSATRTAAAVSLIAALTGCVPAAQVRSTDPETVAIETQVEERPDDPELRKALGAAYAREFEATGTRTRLDRAIAELREAHALAPGDVSASEMLYVALARRMTRFGERGDVAALRALYDSTPALSTGPFGPPEFAQAMLELGYAREDAAVDLLKQAIKVKPGFHRSHMVLGLLYASDGRYELSLSLLRRAAELAPEDADAQLSLGRVYADKVESLECRVDDLAAVDAGIAAFKRTVSLAPDNAAAHRGLARLYEIRGRDALYLFAARKAEALRGDAEDRIHLAGALVLNGRLEEAIATYEALRGTPDLPRPVDAMIARAHLVSGDEGLAARHFDRLRESGGMDNPYDWFLRAAIARRAGDEALASRLLSEVPEARLTDWPRDVLGYLRDARGADALVAGARDACQETEARFYVAYTRLARGDRAGAKAELDAVIRLGAAPYVEYSIARSLLERL